VKTPPKIPPAPKHLSRASKIYWGKVAAEYDLTDSDIVILESICSALDREQQCRDGLKKHGSLTIVDRWGVEKIHPLAIMERTSRASVLAGIKALGIDQDNEPKEDGRNSRRVF
jgi:P27 family predicted phage terminase small subunit